MSLASVSATADDFAALPSAMAEARRWLLWRLIPATDPTKKPRKVPYYVCGTPRNGVLDTDEDLSRLATLDAALVALASGSYTGLGFALGPDGTGNYWQGIDLDNITDQPALRLLSDDLPGYTETSPSGKGTHAIGYGRAFSALGSNGSGIEAYSSGRYFTVTADEAGLHNPVCLADFVERVLAPKHGRHAAPAPATVLDFASAQTLAELRSALASMRSDDRDLWVSNGQRLKRLGEQGRALWMEWSQQSDKFDPADAARVWDSFTADRTGYQAIFAEAQRRGWLNPLSNAALPSRAPVFVPKSDDPYWGFKFAPDMVANIGPTRWLVRKLLPEDCTAVLYGPSGTLKSFVMIDMALSIATGSPWQGKETKQRTVFYLAGEGEQGFAKRVVGWCMKHAMQAPDGFAFRQMPRIQDASQLDQLVEAIRGIEAERGQAGLIIIDTLFTALDGGDENSGKDMGQIIAAMKRLRMEFGAAVVTVHHTGKIGETARGHSSLPSGMDVMLYAKPGPVPLTVEISNPKQKDGAEHAPMLLQASVIPLGIVGEDGEVETSLVLDNPAGELLASQGRAKRTEEGEAKAAGRPAGSGPHQAAARVRLIAMIQEGQLVTEAMLRDELKAQGLNRNQAWYAVKNQIDAGEIVLVDGFLRPKGEE